MLFRSEFNDFDTKEMKIYNHCDLCRRYRPSLQSDFKFAGAFQKLISIGAKASFVSDLIRVIDDIIVENGLPSEVHTARVHKPKETDRWYKTVERVGNGDGVYLKRYIGKSEHLIFVRY